MTLDSSRQPGDLVTRPILSQLLCDSPLLPGFQAKDPSIKRPVHFWCIISSQSVPFTLITQELPQSTRLSPNLSPSFYQTITLSSLRTTTYYYYPKRSQSNTQEGLDAQYRYITIARTPARSQSPPPSTPPLTHSNTSTPIIGSPSTPIERMARGATAQRVAFATDVTSIRRPRDDEYSVMTYYARHADRCNICANPYTAFKQDLPLCDRGYKYARDVAKYIYAKGGKPFSIIDKQNGDRVQIEVPADCQVINSLVKAFDHGLKVNSAPKPILVNPKPSERRERVERLDTGDRSPTYIYATQGYAYEAPRRERRYPREYDLVEIVPSSSRRDRNRSYREERYRKERPVSYHESSRGSLYERDEEERRRRQRYEEQPIVILADPRRREKR
ncbi:hypothetical protein LTR10_014049 [Elasticomyces elasticus]|uniref:Uncharacterized protein n=1 Tax=Exophiala sideris TaxID=1016849 RepID=A0ABR0J3V9_9EURO|nr:hypothetical protein LTR10_014049 [Elasticomyces elasticus]KAK5026455.1 hypothetical protein LTS07_007389 [Exophiala sideris]KAK5033803.1 hypothetical protein LTR13_006855 [Exophiala sideris]KAK5055625.1 hypothetical protein LTR69_008458 [Exophiala sideris]KAK5179990.1 hypothetical protein LTR44_007466 [Eurotiomycetes sp. CCFEE 6388]